VFARGFKVPRWLAVAPNGDIFVTDSRAGELIVLRDARNTGSAQQRETFVTGLDQPFGVAFQGDYVYVGNTSAVARFRFDPKTSKRLGEAEHIIDLPGGGYNQHWTRTVAFSRDGKHLFVSVGSKTNVSVEADERRAAIIICDPDGKNSRIYARGLRNAVGIGIEPTTGQLWASVNERDNIGDNVPPDYFTAVRDGGFYGWPYSYIGDNVDVRATPPQPDLVAKAIVPDVLLVPHAAALEFTFYTASQFPGKYHHGVFIAEHGSWNRATRSGYDVVFIPFSGGKPAADPIPFLTGLVPDPSKRDVYGRPVGIAVAKDGSLLVSDDGAKVIYRISASH
jgi:glucose/arabinose dehydrogenase